MGFAPIKLRGYVRLHLKSNPGSKEADEVARLQSALTAYKAGRRCSCGQPIWVIGASQAGHMCFTCSTGEADCSEDYEIDEACDKAGAP